MRYKVLLMAGLLWSACHTHATAEDYERTKSFARAFRASENTTVQVVNKYGNVHLIPWEKDSVRFEVRLSVQGSKSSRVDRIINDIDFEFTSTRYYVIARTVFRNSMNNLWSDLSDMTNTLFSSGNRANIDYTVYFPADAPVKVENKFGHIYTTDHKARAEFILSNGDLKAHHLAGEVDLNIQFGNATVTRLNHGHALLAYGEFDFTEVGELTLEGRSAEVKIAKAGRVTLDSRRDKIRLQQAGVVRGSSSFSTLDIALLTDEALLSTRYGSLQVHELGNACRHVDLTSEYTDVQLGFAKTQALEVELTYDDKVQTSFNEALGKLEVRKAGEDLRQNILSGKTRPSAPRYVGVKVRAAGGRLTL